ncbi:GNAT family N-acetyltransferase [Loigolactobacillus backii]|uniref:GNAT family acetyltransferase n=1 Tax=Loigolactobacillus backii TaxID=375175 RepID=A0A192GZL8_9LACO|nr:GNAT family N-acetyltransferase [Loigolactobacillus backii]ANK58802.1 GNAT family acetyltransferase [Loigolactobacillus backii]ANK61535.1 GNAT family acetyltransferase [Loigolactobacillus backii]ANK63792.1 GNAT family acetyltransferase [Loigolactobacillus backii]ANK66240.1 GNAT family acetyltransferase [Loigolactobacillus backii]ANK69267.1 GNAT family acetyltransferase [Loigolactobacillus backii]
MQIRPIEPKDDLAVKKLVQDCLAEYQLNLPGTAYFDPQLTVLAEYYANLEYGFYWVLEEDQQVVGGVGIGPYAHTFGTCELQKLYIQKASRGKGYSNQLIKKALDFAAQHYQQVYLETFAKLKVANQIYPRYDFKRLAKPLAGTEHTACDTWYLKQL